MSLYLHFFVYTKFLPTFGNATFARSGIREACCDVQLMYYRSQFSGDEIRLNGPGWISQIYQVGKVVMAEPGQEAVEACASGSLVWNGFWPIG